MARRVSMPAADDLFRPTRPEGAPAAGKPQVRAVPDAEPSTSDQPAKPETSGRIRHDEKMTVYVTADELLAVERARLSLRAEHRLAVDRGRLVREAVALVLHDLEEHGADSLLVQRLGE